ncbi:uncharacterized protein N7479_006436 [Penicillium vulpinum]|uniref:Uncharacterized protein n=1 Tax=Penicillium vulpinum TaxID=29845 RepID=A0A1V6S2G4_9EURO|nr:uncharacterized protein N7479_006436 [Penicillium vulpinum]KAJ5959286.1 hypothetical protein N7479_006436 [Penicillium vulpinum]OQE07920.1 hypothetical protein PENVUL_c011G07145 [Penicillium vulpinum]
MRRSRISGRSKSNNTGFDWYFAGEPMDKRHSRSSRIRLVRYVPEGETCAHSRCPSPSPSPETAPCSCGNECEVHSHGTRSPSPSKADSSGCEAVMTCCGGCHAIKRESGSSGQEKATCSCNNRCERHSRATRPITPSSSEHSSFESATNRYGGRHSRQERRSNNTHPTTPNSNDFSDYEPPRRRRHGHRFFPTREPEHHLQVEKCQCESHARPASTPAMPSQRYSSPRATFATAPPRSGPMFQTHQCRKASWCESHPEACRASMPAPSPVPISTPTPSRHSSRVKSDPKCTCRRSASPPKQVPPPKPVSSRHTSPAPNVQRCSCLLDGYHADDSGYYYDDDSGSDNSIQAMPDNDRDVDETFCIYHHRCRPRFECGLGWVCGRD